MDIQFQSRLCLHWKLNFTNSQQICIRAHTMLLHIYYFNVNHLMFTIQYSIKGQSHPQLPLSSCLLPCHMTQGINAEAIHRRNDYMQHVVVWVKIRTERSIKFSFFHRFSAAPSNMSRTHKNTVLYPYFYRHRYTEWKERHQFHLVDWTTLDH